MAGDFFSGEQIDRMKADAIKRARQMHMRAAIPNANQNTQHTIEEHIPQNSEGKTKSSPRKLSSPGLQNILQMIKMMGFENDQLILIALILMLSGEEDNMPIILALLYIAM